MTEESSDAWGGLGVGVSVGASAGEQHTEKKRLLLVWDPPWNANFGFVLFVWEKVERVDELSDRSGSSCSFCFLV